MQNNPVNTHLTGYAEKYTGFQVKESSIQGKGLFTDSKLRKGTVLFEIVGERIQHEYDPALSDLNPNWIGTGYEEWLMLGPGDIAIYLNHSCQPNVIINDKLQLVTLAPVQATSELLLDYSTTELDPYWKMNCSCGAAGCRKALRAYQFLSEELHKKYGKFLTPSFTSTAKVLALHQKAS